MELLIQVNLPSLFFTLFLIFNLTDKVKSLFSQILLSFGNHSTQSEKKNEMNDDRIEIFFINDGDQYDVASLKR